MGVISKWALQPPELPFESVAEACRYGLRISSHLDEELYSAHLNGISCGRRVGTIAWRNASGTAHIVLELSDEQKLASKFPLDDMQIVAFSVFRSVAREDSYQLSCSRNIFAVWTGRPVLTPEYVYRLLSNTSVIISALRRIPRTCLANIVTLLLALHPSTVTANVRVISRPALELHCERDLLRRRLDSRWQISQPPVRLVAQDTRRAPRDRRRQREPRSIRHNWFVPSRDPSGAGSGSQLPLLFMVFLRRRHNSMLGSNGALLGRYRRRPGSSFGGREDVAVGQGCPSRGRPRRLRRLDEWRHFHVSLV